MKDFDTRVYSISDMLEWREADLLELSPDFQRRSVWSSKAKSYLVDTVLRGKPMPKILIQQKQVGKRNHRIVIDGQQRLRAILDFYDDGFRISRAHNREFAGAYFSSLDPDIQNEYLKYEVSVDVIFDAPYEELLDIFARINTYTAKLNAQELRNAKYVGYFKQAAYRVGYSYVKYWVESGILTKSSVTRMSEAEFSSDLLVTLMSGVQGRQAINKHYEEFEDEEGNLEKCENKFDRIMSYLAEVYSPEELRNTEWASQPLFYTLFCAIAHGAYGLEGAEETPRPKIPLSSSKKVRVILDDLSSQIAEFSQSESSRRHRADFRAFIDRARRRTADVGARRLRLDYLSHVLADEMGER